MTTRLLAALVLSGVIAVPAFADGDHGYPSVNPVQAGTLSRADVKAELAQARADGQLEFSQTNYPALPRQPQVDSLTRAQVTAELAHARAAHDVSTDLHS
ncbi:DUF4148 domain-containing protein [Caballeronia sp. LjRoot34]|uniref:DUF4148 domain-containing protein n=1 Tax=Caballeronia sp. LjRoot34 TaxID=3342325 RepID=UPI003ECFC61F